MPNFAIHDGTTVVNVIIADSVEVAEELTGLSALETEGAPWIGWTMEVEGWRPPSPFPSWSWDGAAWVAPIPEPEGFYLWDEDAQEWVRGPQPFPSWSWDDTLGNWAPPVPYPGSPEQPYIWDENALEWVAVTLPAE